MVSPTVFGITGKTLCEQNLLSIYLTKSEKEILYIHNPSNLSSESLYLCVKRFCGSISGAVVKEVQDIFVVIVYCFLYCTECVNSRFLHIVKPARKFCVCNTFDFCLRINQS